MINQERYREELNSEQKIIAERRWSIVSVGKLIEKKLKNRENCPDGLIKKYALTMKERDFLWRSLLSEASAIRKKELLDLISKYNKEGVDQPVIAALEGVDRKYLKIDGGKDENPRESYSFLDDIFFENR